MGRSQVRGQFVPSWVKLVNWVSEQVREWTTQRERVSEWGREGEGARREYGSVNKMTRGKEVEKGVDARVWVSITEAEPKAFLATVSSGGEALVVSLCIVLAVVVMGVCVIFVSVYFPTLDAAMIIPANRVRRMLCRYWWSCVPAQGNTVTHG